MPPQALPKIGDIVNFHRFTGGDPGQETSWQPLNGEDYLKAIPPARANIVRGVLQGRAPFPNSRATKPDAFSNQLLQDVAMADPGFDAATWKTRQATLNDFKNGKVASQIAALNMGIHHATGMMDAYDNLDNYDTYPFVNAVANTVAQGYNPRVRAGMAAANLNANALASETAAIFQGGAPHQTEIENYRKDYDPNAGPSASNASLGKAAALFHDRLQTLQSRWRNAMGPLGGEFPIVSPETQKDWDTLSGHYDVRTGELKPRKPPAPESLPRNSSAPGRMPAGIDPKLWRHMTLQEKALWQN